MNKGYQENKKVLLLDDELNILKTLARLITRFGYQPTIATQASKAVSLLSQENFALIISDYRMPEMVGTEFLAIAKEKSQHSFRILLTGYADVGAAINAVNKSSVYKYLTKPWDEEVLKRTLEEAIKQYNLNEKNRFLEKEIKKAAIKLQEINKNLEKIVEKRTCEIQSLNQKLESGFLASIKLMGEVAHKGNKKHAEHAKRVALLSVEIAKKLGWSGRDLLEIQIAGYLHDIAESFENRQINHPQAAYELMKMIPNLGKAYDYVKHHHELRDGSGYPDGLKVDQIPLGAQIIGVADYYDENLNLGESAQSATANKIIFALKEKCPKHYDEKIVIALFEYLKETGKINDEHFEVVVNLITLMPGMILSRDLYTRSGKKLLPKDNKMTKEYIERVFKRHAEDPLGNEIYVYKSSINQSQESEAS